MILIKDKIEWKGFMLNMGAFFVHCSDGKRFSMGKCDPITKEVLEWYEYKK